MDRKEKKSASANISSAIEPVFSLPYTLYSVAQPQLSKLSQHHELKK